ncbi:MAG: GTP-binding protein, partial [Methylohalobius sp.]
AMIDTALSQALAIYRSDFLDHPIAYATFQRALAELLILLEIPGLAQPMMAIRRAITWPIKALLGKRRNAGADAVQELFILRRSVEHALLQLLTSIRDQTHETTAVHWWQEIDRCYQAAYPALIRFFETESLTYYRAFAPQVEAAAMRLYRRLQEMPATLNSLRAARVGADAAGLALLFQTGGIGPHDVVLAPAMLSLTSLLAESALGKYMEIVAADLKRTQLKAVKTLLQGLGEKIFGLVEQMDTNICFNFPEAVLTQVEDILNERTYGLKLFSSARD